MGLGLCFVLSSVGCGGVDERHAAAASAGAGGENHVAEPGGTSGSGGAAASEMPGGTSGSGGNGASEMAGDTSGPVTNVGGTNGTTLPACTRSPAADYSSAHVLDPDGSLSAVPAHAKVTVTSVQQTPSPADQGRGLLTRQYSLQADSTRWNLSVTSPSLTDDLIQQGDVLDFELAISDGAIPFAGPLKDQTFALLADGKPRLFASDLQGYGPPIPTFPIAGLSVSDKGPSCSTPATGACGLAGHVALLRLGSASATVETGHVAQLGDFSVAVPAFGTATGSNCDDSGRTVIVGVNVAPH